MDTLRLGNEGTTKEIAVKLGDIFRGLKDSVCIRKHWKVNILGNK